MKYSHTLEDRLIILSLSGDLIGEEDNGAILKDVDGYIARGMFFSVIDISEVRYINSSGIGLLITILTKLRNRGGEICLVNPSETVQKLLIITKLHAIFKVANSKNEAKNQLLNK
jgi:anti-sigma B factor antagonist